MPFNLDDFTFHLGEYSKELRDLTPKLNAVQYSALISTSAMFILKNRASMMSSRYAAAEVIRLIKGVLDGTFPPAQETKNADRSPDQGPQDLNLGLSQQLPGVYGSPALTEDPSLQPASGAHPDDHPRTIPDLLIDPPLLGLFHNPVDEGGNLPPNPPRSARPD